MDTQQSLLNSVLSLGIALYATGAIATGVIQLMFPSTKAFSKWNAFCLKILLMFPKWLWKEHKKTLIGIIIGALIVLYLISNNQPSPLP